MNSKRAQLLSDGYVILRQVVPPGQLDRLRSDIETVVARQRASDPEWDRTPQPRASIIDQVDAATIGAFEFLLHENTHGVSAEVLDCSVEAVASNQALVICNPEFRPEDPPRPGQHWGTDPRNWHRDVRPDRDGPLGGLIEDQLANGPAYVQWNIALYEDHILYVVPGSHRRLSTEIESSHLQAERGTISPVPESRCVELGPGDGVVYNNLMLHWGSKYGPEKKRRTVHLGYRSFGRIFPRQQCNLPMGFWKRFEAGTPQRQVAQHWFELFRAEFATIEETFRAALSGNEEGFRAGLRLLHPPENGRRTCLILLAKLAMAVHQQRSSPGGDGAGRSVYEWQLQELASRFSDPELARLWRRFEPIDEALRSGASRHVSGFLGPTTDYEFEKVPAGMTAEGMCAEILGQPQRFVHSGPPPLPA